MFNSFNALNINRYIKDGFTQVCKVDADQTGRWFYQDINENVMYSGHKSWVYFIVVDDQVVKIGETGNPLGIRQAGTIQPKMGSTSRLGRYRNGDQTDTYIREELRNEVASQRVSIWAKPCQTVAVEVNVGGVKTVAVTSFHKDLEMKYMDFVYRENGSLPTLNKTRK